MNASHQGDIAFTNVSKRFGDFTAVSNASFTIEGGSFVSILGPSGCGKTTTLRMIAGFDFASEGSIEIGGVDVGHRPPYERPINMVFQNYALFPHLNVFDNIAYGLRSRRNRRPKQEVNERVGEVIEKTQLQGKEQNRIWQLSGGQQQRVALARAIVNNPTILILDEPLAALDKKLRRDVQFELQSLQRNLGITFIMVTHDQHEALSLSDKIIVMNKGRIEQIGSPQDLYNRPASRFVASFIGDFNLHPATVTESGADGCVLALGRRSLRVAATTPAPAAGANVHVGYRPDDVRLAHLSPERQKDPARASITNIIYLGDKAEIRLTSPETGDIIARLGVDELQRQAFAVGQEVETVVDAGNYRIFTN